MAPLLSRTLDPLLGIFTGLFAYYLYENHPRTALSQTERLLSLTQWRVANWRYERERKLRGSEQEEAGISAIRSAAEKE